MAFRFATTNDRSGFEGTKSLLPHFSGFSFPIPKLSEMGPNTQEYLSNFPVWSRQELVAFLYKTRTLKAADVPITLSFKRASVTSLIYAYNTPSYNNVANPLELPEVYTTDYWQVATRTKFPTYLTVEKEWNNYEYYGDGGQELEYIDCVAYLSSFVSFILHLSGDSFLYVPEFFFGISANYIYDTWGNNSVRNEYGYYNKYAVSNCLFGKAEEGTEFGVEADFITDKDIVASFKIAGKQYNIRANSGYHTNYTTPEAGAFVSYGRPGDEEEIAAPTIGQIGRSGFDNLELKADTFYDYSAY